MRRFSLDEYHRMIEIGLLKEDEPYELLDGWITQKMPINPPHSSAVTRLARRLERLFGDRCLVRSQSSVTIPSSDSEPEPDVVVAAGSEEDFDAAHPHPHQIVILAEVSDSSLDRDRGEKLIVYAAAKITEYWIVNLQDRQVEVYTDPKGGKSPTYRTRTDYGPDDAVPVALAGKSLGSIPAHELLP